MRGELEILPADRSLVPDDFISQLPIAGLMNAMPVRLKAEETLKTDLVVGFDVTDVRQAFTFHVRRGVVEVRTEAAEQPELAITTTSGVWKSIVFRKRSPAAAYLSGDLELKGGVIDVVAFLNLFERTTETYPHVLNRGPAGVRSPADQL